MKPAVSVRLTSRAYRVQNSTARISIKSITLRTKLSRVDNNPTPSKVGLHLEVDLRRAGEAAGPTLRLPRPIGNRDAVVRTSQLTLRCIGRMFPPIGPTRSRVARN